MTPHTRPLWQRFLIFLVPLMAANILQSLSGTINNIYIGQLLGVDALAAVSVSFPIVIFLISFIIGLSSGSTVLIGQAWGARNLEKVKQVTGTTLTTTFLAGTVVAILGGIFTPQIMQVLGAPPNVLDAAIGYARVLLIGMPGFFLFLVVTSILRGVGDSVTPLVALGLSTAIGLLITPALILGWFGLPQIGIMAAACATIGGFSVTLVALAFYLRWRKHPLAPDMELARHLAVDGKLLLLILRLGVPAGVQMVVSSISAIVIVGLVNHYGSSATAAYGAVNQVLSYVQFPAMSIGIAASIFAAQAIGARQVDQVNRITKTGLGLNLAITGGLVLIAYLFSEKLVALFITEPSVIVLTETLLHIVLWSVVLFGMSAVFSAVMRASGTVLVPMLLSLATIIVVEVPAAILLSQHFGLNGIWMGYALSFSTMLVLQAGYYMLFWRKKTIVALV